MEQLDSHITDLSGTDNGEFYWN